MSHSTAPCLKSLDSFEFESRFSTDNLINYEEIRDSSVSYEEMRPLLSLLPQREVDLIELYCKYQKNQKDIAKMFGVTQGAISSRLARARKRLKFIRDLPKIPDGELEEDLGSIFEPLELEILKCMMRTTCQTKTAEIINKRFDLKDDKRRMTQVKVRHRFEKCVSLLESKTDENPELQAYLDLLKLIKKNYYMLHEVKLPHFDRGERAVFSMKTSWDKSS